MWYLFSQISSQKYSRHFFHYVFVRKGIYNTVEMVLQCGKTYGKHSRNKMQNELCILSLPFLEKNTQDLPNLRKNIVKYAVLALK